MLSEKLRKIIERTSSYWAEFLAGIFIMASWAGSAKDLEGIAQIYVIPNPNEETFTYAQVGEKWEYD